MSFRLLARLEQVMHGGNAAALTQACIVTCYYAFLSGVVPKNCLLPGILSALQWDMHIVFEASCRQRVAGVPLLLFTLQTAIVSVLPIRGSSKTLTRASSYVAAV